MFIFLLLYLLLLLDAGHSLAKEEKRKRAIILSNFGIGSKLSSGERTGRKTNFILGQYLDISFFIIFDLCAERLSSTTKIF